MAEQNIKEENCLKEGKKKVWKFVHQEQYSYETDRIPKSRVCDYNWLKISDGVITVKGDYNNGYAWDGCTPKFNALHITWGNFDGKLKRFGKGNYRPYTYYASMVHDILYQYKRCAPITRKEADLIFFDILNQSGYMWKWVYYYAVRFFGWYFSGWKYKSRKEI
ncbi:MAG: DUF1353 domain-containing protein [Cytophagia bacterium]|nr:DUF1353 domain-containing protein [Cytophagia bacterium]